MEIKIAIGIATNRQVKPKTVKSLLELVANSRHDFHIVVATEGFTTAENRIFIVSQAIQNNCSHVLFVDDDMTFPPNTLDVLLSSGKDIIGVNSKSRRLPIKSTVVMLPEDYEREGEIVIPEIPKTLFKAKFVGTGVMLVNMKVFDNLDTPWFDVKTHEFGMVKQGEDAYFCEKAQEKGFEVWCDPTISIGHIGDYEFI